MLTVHDLDEMNQKELLALSGKKARHHTFGVGTICTAGTREKRRAVLRIKLPCHADGCKKMFTVYLGSGLHNGAWCYCFDKKTGKYLANLRDQVVACSKHRR